MAGKIQNEDVKTLAEITGAGGSASQLTNDTKIYLTALGLNKQLSQAITDGDLSGGGSSPNYQTFSNLGLSASASAGALTIRLRQADGTTDPAAGTGAVVSYFRSPTVTSGAVVRREITSALSLVVPSGATLGIGSLVPSIDLTVGVYLVDDGGTVRLAVKTKCFFGHQIGSITSISAAADDADTFFSDATSASKAITFIGLLYFNAAGLNGTWVNPSGIYVGESAKSLLDGEQLKHIMNITTLTGGTSGNWLVGTNNQANIPAGRYQLWGHVDFGNNGTTPAYTVTAAVWSSAQGTNTTAAPSGIGAVNPSPSHVRYSYGVANPNMSAMMPVGIFEVNSTRSFFLIVRVTATTMANISVTQFAEFRKIG